MAFSRLEFLKFSGCPQKMDRVSGQPFFLKDAACDAHGAIIRRAFPQSLRFSGLDRGALGAGLV